ncbi:MAG: tyrosine-type recombinase/integrase [Caldimonas sp.]
MIVTALDPRSARTMRPGDHLAFREYPGLRLVASKSRHAWTYRYTHPDTGQQRQLGLGFWPAIGFGEAVDKWRTARNLRFRGVDVAQEKRAASQDRKARAIAVERRERYTCSFISQRYLAEVIEVHRKAKGATEARRMLERALRTVATTSANELTKAQARDVISSIAESAPRVAAMTRQELRGCWAYASDQGWIEEGRNPFAAKNLGGVFKAKSRERALQVAEVRALLQWMREPRAYSRTVADALELVLRTALRSGEVCAMQVGDFEEREGVLWLHIPGERMKEGRAHLVPLIGRARTIVEDRIRGAKCFLFPARDGETSIAQKVLGVEVYAHSGRSEARAYVGNRTCPVNDWAPHDLRRTARTLLAELGCPFEVAELILAHALPGVAAVYNRAKYEAEKVIWLGRLNDQLDELGGAATPSHKSADKRPRRSRRQVPKHQDASATAV